jgi:hypothetical protein
MKKIDVQPTSLHSATCSDIILKRTDRVRLVFRPEIVDNASNPDARVKGTFVYQRKGAGDSWEKFDTIPLSSLKAGEGYQLALHSDQVFTLRRELYELARLHAQQGIPQTHTEFVKVESDLKALLQLTEPEFRRFLSANRSNAIKIFSRVVHWLAEAPQIAAQLALDEVELPTLNAIVSRANIQWMLDLWAKNSNNHDEDFWQSQLSKHTFALGLLFAHPIVIIREKAYVGGKSYDNQHGNLADFLAKIPGSANAVIIEIKTPVTPLLGSEYRQDIFPPSRDFIGAISQVIHYREALTGDANVRAEARLSLSEPRCAVLIGDKRRLADDPRKRAFERFRERLTGVMVVTFDEFFSRIKTLHSLFE